MRSFASLQHLMFDMPTPTGPPISIYGMRAVLALAEGQADLKYMDDGSGRRLYFEQQPDRRQLVDVCIYDPTQRTVAADGLLYQPPQAAIPMAAALLVKGTGLFVRRYLNLLNQLSDDVPDLDQELIDTAWSLVGAINHEIEPITWLQIKYNSKSPAKQRPVEADDPSARDVGKLFLDLATLTAFLDGSSDEFAFLR